MKKDIPIQRVKDIAVAIVPRDEPLVLSEEDLWDVFIINLKKDPIKNVFVSSRGYGQGEEGKIKTTTLRHFFVEIAPKSAAAIESIQIKLFQLTNEYWVSFVHEDYMYDKRYTFVVDSITPLNFTNIPLLDCKGVMIK